jgi:hypothetical protein
VFGSILAAADVWQASANHRPPRIEQAVDSHRARRNRWRIQPGNDGRTLVMVPDEDIVQASSRPPVRTPDHEAEIARAHARAERAEEHAKSNFAGFMRIHAAIDRNPNASITQARELSTIASKSLARRRARFNQPRVRSTIQRFGSTTKNGRTLPVEVDADGVKAECCAGLLANLAVAPAPEAIAAHPPQSRELRATI